MSFLINNQRGFSLVELAISVTVIGILLAGVVKGREVLESSRALSIASQMLSYQKAIRTFEDAYGALPGDMRSAQMDIPYCIDDGSADDTHCRNGDGNLIIGEIGVTSLLNDDQAGAGGLKEETTQFWKHLALAGMITDIQVNADPDAPAWGVTHPKAHAVNAGFAIAKGNHVFVDAHWLVLRKNVTGNAYVNSDNANAISPIMAKAMDRKLDDGVPDAGLFQQPDANNRCDTGSYPKSYNATYSKECMPIFNLGLDS